MDRFSFLKKEWIEIYDLISEAERKTYDDSNIALIKLRQIVELVTKYILDKNGEKNNQNKLQKQINQLSKCDPFNNEMVELFQKIRIDGNKAAHENYSNIVYTKKYIDEIIPVLVWFTKEYGTGHPQQIKLLDLSLCDIVLPFFSIMNLGHMTYKEKELFNIAKDLCLEAAEMGNPWASYKLAELYETGKGLEKNKIKAIEWYKKSLEDFINAAEMGDVKAMKHIGLIYSLGIGVDKNQFKAKEWYSKVVDVYRKSADKGDTNAIYDLGYKYEYIDDYDNSGRCFRKAMMEYKKAADLGDTESMYRLGTIHMLGKGVDKNQDIANYWFNKAIVEFEKAADAGDVEAMYDIGVMYYDGYGVDEDRKKAAEWYIKAIELDDAPNPDDIYYIANQYEIGDGLEENLTKAEEWYKKALEEYKRAANKGDVVAMYKIGNMYKYGIGVEEDEEQEILWFKKGLNINNSLHF